MDETRVYVVGDEVIGNAASERLAITLPLAQGVLARLIAVHYFFEINEITAGQHAQAMALADQDFAVPASYSAFFENELLFGMANSDNNNGVANGHMEQRNPEVVPLHGIWSGSRLWLHFRNDSGSNSTFHAELYYEELRGVAEALALNVESRGRR